jgi:hypothetical protein
MVLHVLVIKKCNFKHYTSNEYSSMERHAEGRNDTASSASVDECVMNQLPKGGWFASE